jgi:hypothetical protein
MKTDGVGGRRNRFRKLSQWLEAAEASEIVEPGGSVVEPLPELPGNHKTRTNATPGRERLPAGPDELAAAGRAARE